MIAHRTTWISVCLFRRRPPPRYTIGIIGLAVMRFKTTAE